MQIKTKYNIGDRIWIAYKNKDETVIYDDTIEEIVVREKIVMTTMGVPENRQIIEYIGDKCPEGIPEEDIVLYYDNAKLVELIRRLRDEE